MPRKTEEEQEAILQSKIARIQERKRIRAARADKGWKAAVLAAEATLRRHRGAVAPEYAVQYESAHAGLKALAEEV